jgi:hypothetical protein
MRTPGRHTLGLRIETATDGPPWMICTLDGSIGLRQRLTATPTHAMLVVCSVRLVISPHPADALGAPIAPAVPQKIRGVAVIIVVMAILLPLLAISLLALWLFDRLLLPRLPAFAMWLGVRPAQLA